MMCEDMQTRLALSILFMIEELMDLKRKLSHGLFGKAFFHEVPQGQPLTTSFLDVLVPEGSGILQKWEFFTKPFIIITTAFFSLPIQGAS